MKAYLFSHLSWDGFFLLFLSLLDFFVFLCLFRTQIIRNFKKCEDEQARPKRTRGAKEDMVLFRNQRAGALHAFIDCSSLL